LLLRSIKYVRPASLDEAIERLAGAAVARPLAGGQSLINVLKQRAAEVDLLVDISRLDELRSIQARGDGSVEIGAAVTYDAIQRDPAVIAAHPKVAEVAAGLVDQQVRCRGTIGGNACLNDPGSNYPPLLIALDAVMRVAGPGGQRDVPASDFFLDTYRVALKPGELLRSVVLPPADGRTLGYSSLQLARDSWAVARAVVRVRCNGAIAEPLVVLGCVSGGFPRAVAVEEALAGAVPGSTAIAAAAELADRDIEPRGDAHASAAYRRQMARVVVGRAIAEATDAARRSDG
jgi:carbon-monoxide dehydrogenase medium subunit